MKIFLVTSTRADFGLLKNLIFEFKKNSFFDLKIIAAGTHFSKNFGNTYKEIKFSKIKLYKKIIINSKFNNSIDISFVISKHLMEITKIFKKSKPDLMIILGDRYEILAAAIASHISGVPIAHIHGGEVTVGTVDEAFRHSITKMSHIHFVSNKIYKNRVVQLGENPKNVFVTGGLGVDSIKNTELLNKKEIENKLRINFCKKNIIINFHPETLNKKKVKAQLNELLKALKTLTDTCFIFTGPGADAENIIIKRIIKKFISKEDNAYYFNSLGQKNYLSILKLVDCMIGNSSSGLLEMPTFRKPSINLGIRQKGRIKSKSVIDSKIISTDIIKSIKKVYSKKFIETLKNSKNLNGFPGASKKIVNIIKKYKFKNILNKEFYDI